MQLTINQSDLSNAIVFVSRAVPQRPDQPILANILLTADKEAQTATLTAFDMSIGIKSKIDATVTTGGSICLPAKLFTDMVSRLSSATVDLSMEDLVVTLSSGGWSSTIACLSADDFPQLPSPENETQGIPVDVLVAGLRATASTMATDETKQVLCGLRMLSTPKGLEFAATDGHRLAVSFQPQSSEPIDIILPRQTAQALLKLLSAKDCAGSASVVLEDRQIMFSLPGQSIVSRLLDGQYPNYNQLIPRQFERSAACDRKALVAALERVAVMADQKNNVVKLSIDTDSMVISSEVSDVGSASEAIAVRASGDAIEIAFNVNYLLNGLKAMDSLEVLLEMNNPRSPAIVSPIGGSMIYLIMPVQIRE